MFGESFSRNKKVTLEPQAYCVSCVLSVLNWEAAQYKWKDHGIKKRSRF